MRLCHRLGNEQMLGSRSKQFPFHLVRGRQDAARVRKSFSYSGWQEGTERLSPKYRREGNVTSAPRRFEMRTEPD